METILVLDDESAVVDFMAATLEDAGYMVHGETSPEEGLKACRSRSFDLACIDISMPAMSGVEVAGRVMEISPETEILMVTGRPESGILSRCLEQGITHYLFKPFQGPQLVYSVFAALYHRRLRRSLAASGGQGPFVGISLVSQRIRKQVERYAGSLLPVLILGESGTGKEIVARELHRLGPRSGAPFVPVNCATLGELADSELFGHCKGAFTGAVAASKGYIGEAEGGTLFLDEIGELPYSAQAKLLRFLDNREYSRVGESTTRSADVRVVAATNRDLKELCSKGGFREDLYYRLAGMVIDIPPLRERPEDIPPLAWHFLEEYAAATGRYLSLAADALVALAEYPWPGNARQLKNVVWRICEEVQGGVVRRVDLINHLDVPESSIERYQDAKKAALAAFDREYFTRLVVASQGSLKRALELSGMHKKNFYMKLKSVGLSLRSMSRAIKRR